MCKEVLQHLVVPLLVANMFLMQFAALTAITFSAHEHLSIYLSIYLLLFIYLYFPKAWRLLNHEEPTIQPLNVHVHTPM